MAILSMKKLVYIALFLGGVSSCTQQSAPVTDATQTDSVEVSTPSVSGPVRFHSEEEIRSYLCAHRFKSDEGEIIRFADQANEIDFQDMPVAVSTLIAEFNDTTALIKGSGNLGESTIRITIKPTGNVLEDVNDGVLYWEEK